jgi:hypothetical protein
MIPYEGVAMNSLEIRDTNSVNSSVVENIYYQTKTIIIHNSLNQTVTLQCQASRDGENNWFNVGTPFDVTANTNTYQTCDSYFPYMRFQAQCSNAPTSGNLSLYFERIPV